MDGTIISGNRGNTITGSIFLHGVNPMLKCAIVSVFLYPLVTGLSLFSQPVPLSLGNDWDSNTIQAIGVGEPPPNPANIAHARTIAIRGAIVDAQKKLGWLVYNLPINAETTVQDLVDENEIVRDRVQALLRGARRVGPPEYLKDGSISLAIEIHRSELSDLVLPTEGFSLSPPPTEENDPEGYTGLVIDTRGLHLAVALSPKLIDDKETIVYGASFLTRAEAVKNGVVGYVKDLESAKINFRGGTNPLIAKCLRGAGKNKTDVILSAEDSQNVREAARGFLALGKVLFVID